jgi:starvation-inducible DNA-binding protein
MNNTKNEKITETINLLNDLLANNAIYYQNLRSMHWNVRGIHFFTLHQKFEEEYLDAQDSVDEIAERVLSLGGKPKSSFSVYINDSEISEFDQYVDAKSSIETVVKNLNVLLQKEKKILELASENKDDGTADLMTQFISKQEKNRWMFNASITN